MASKGYISLFRSLCGPGPPCPHHNYQKDFSEAVIHSLYVVILSFLHSLCTKSSLSEIVHISVVKASFEVNSRMGNYCKTWKVPSSSFS